MLKLIVRQSVYSNLGNSIPNSSSNPAPQKHLSIIGAKSKVLYYCGIILLVVGFAIGMGIVALHYGTACSMNNIFACHSLYSPAGGNILPYFGGISVLVFAAGLALGFVYGPRTVEVPSV